MKNKLGLRILALAFSLCVILGLWGCGGRELYERLMIHGIGVDVDGDGFLVTVRSSGSPGEEGEECFECRGSTVLEALSSLSLLTGRKPFYAHNYLVVFGKECAEQGLDRCIDFFVRYYNTRPAVRVFLSESSAGEILSYQKDGAYLRMAELQQLGDSGPESGKAVVVELLDFVNGAMRQGSASVLPVLRAEEDGVRLVSTAYFQEFTLEGFLSPEETRGFLAVKDLLKGSEAVVEGEFGKATLSLSGGKGKVTFSRQEENLPEFLVEFHVNGEISSLSGQGELSGQALLLPMQRELEALLGDEISAAIKKSLLKDGCDIFGFGNLLFRKSPNEWKTLREDWTAKAKSCEYRVKVTAQVQGLE